MLDYVRKYPKGKYVGRAKSLVAELEKKEKDAIEESRAFNQCRTQSDYMNYLNKYPIGAYSDKAKAIVEEFELKEIEENRVYNLCKDKSDYLAYLRKYPNGKYVKEAHAKINVLECEEKRKREQKGVIHIQEGLSVREYHDRDDDPEHGEIVQRARHGQNTGYKQRKIEQHAFYIRCRNRLRDCGVRGFIRFVQDKHEDRDHDKRSREIGQHETYKGAGGKAEFRIQIKVLRIADRREHTA